MKEARIDILSDDVLAAADAICFTSNGVIKKDGSLVMGAGVAKAFRDTYRGIDGHAGNAVKKCGNVCQQVMTLFIGDDMLNIDRTVEVVAFPTKHHWRNSSDLKLIEKSAKELMKLVEENEWSVVYLPRPGCRNGGLDWYRDVKPLLKTILDDRIVVVTK